MDGAGGGESSGYACNQPLLWRLWLLPRSSLSVLLRVPVLCHPGSSRWNNSIIISTVARTAHGVLHWGGLLQCMYMKGSLKVLSLSDKEWGQFFGWQTPSHPHPQQQQKTNKIQEEFPSHFHQDAMAIKTRDISLNGRTPDSGATTKHFPCLCHSGFALTLGKWLPDPWSGSFGFPYSMSSQARLLPEPQHFFMATQSYSPPSSVVKVRWLKIIHQALTIDQVLFFFFEAGTLSVALTILQLTL